MMHALLFAAAVQGAAITAVSPPPPMVVQAPMPPPPIVAVARAPVVMQANDIARVRVRIAAGNLVLFDDELRVGRGSGASYSESRSEAPEINCSSDRYYGGSGDRDSLNLQLYLREDSQMGQGMNVNVTWQRPAGTTACPSEGSRSVSLVQSVRLAPGETQTLRGDAGLVVTLTRR